MQKSAEWRIFAIRSESYVVARCSRDPNNAHALFDRVLQGLRSAEFGHSHRLDLDRSSGAGVPSHAAGACLCLKNAETCDRDLIALLEAVGDHRDDCFD